MSRHTEDLQLVDRLLAGDRQAFETFAESSSRALYRFTLGRVRGNRELTRDLVQAAMTKAIAKLDTYRGKASLQTWLCSLCLNEIRMHFRRIDRSPHETALENAEGAEPATGFGMTPGTDPEAAMLRRERSTLVHVALEGLPERYAQALEWKYLERQPVNEIAARLGLKLKATESLLTRARGAFRAAFDELQRMPALISGDSKVATLERSTETR